MCKVRLKGALSAEKAVHGSETEIRELLEGSKANNIKDLFLQKAN